jgi:hypothetical protein
MSGIAAAFVILSASAQEPGSRVTKTEPGSGLATTETAPEAAAISPIQPATVAVDFGAEEADFLRTERLNTWDNGDPAPHLRADDVAFLSEQGLHSEIVRMGFAVDELCDVTANACDFSSISDWVGDISESTDSLMVHLTPKHMIEENRPPADTKPLLTLAIKELKKHFPKIDYIEATNEPDWEFHGAQIYAGKEPKLQPDEVYAYYVPYYQAVNEVNEALPPSERIKIGGPALTGMTETWMTAFLDEYAAFLSSAPTTGPGTSPTAPSASFPPAPTAQTPPAPSSPASASSPSSATRRATSTLRICAHARPSTPPTSARS